MRETITMTSSDQRGTRALTRLVAGELTVAEMAVLLGRSERSIWRLRRRYIELGVDAIVHGNRGRTSPPAGKGALSLVIGPAVGFTGAIAVGQNLWELGMLLVVVGIVSFLAGWFTLGVAAIRLDRTSSALRPA